MRPLLVTVLACLGTGCFAQSKIQVKVGPPEFVAKNVRNVTWSNDGRSLVYETSDSKGRKLGVYDLDGQDGKTVLDIPEGTDLDQIVWLNSGKKCLAVLKQRTTGTTVTVNLLDAHGLTARQVWTHTYGPKQAANVMIEPSPTLAHALLTVTGEKADEVWVLTLGGGSVVFSRDIQAAQMQGSSFAGWSQSGTAIFGPGTKNSEFVIDGKQGDIKADKQSDGVNVTAITISAVKLSLDGHSGVVESDGGLKSSLVFLARLRPNYETGASVLECMPANAALRQIKFQGYYADPLVDEPNAEIRSENQQLVMGKSKAGANSLWIVPQNLPPQDKAPAHTGIVVETPKREVQKPEWGVLVSAQADQAWPAPQLTAVAFTWNGALFVRPVSVSDK